jgi:hypothetical protein
VAGYTLVSNGIQQREDAVTMPVGDSHLAFAAAAAEDGIVLSDREIFEWFSELGHLAIEELAEEPPAAADAEALMAAAEGLEAIYADLGGDFDVLLNCRANLYLPVDLVHEPTGTVIEIDEKQHFTSYRLAALDAYPADAKLGFDPEAYRELCRTWAPTTDKFARAQAAKGFGIGGLQRQRAYRDALLDLAVPALGRPPVVRIVALDDDGEAAYQRHRESLLSLVVATH